MNNFKYYNPVTIVFGKGFIAAIADLIPRDQKVMIVYGGGSIKKNGVYDQVVEALKGHKWTEFSGIEANPEFETCVKARDKAIAEEVDFILAVGGGSVVDASKFISVITGMADTDPWEILAGKQKIQKALPLGTIITLPGTGSEMNNGAVISRREMTQKRPLSSGHLFPRFSILDPETAYSLPQRQTANGIADAYIHVLEQYLTYPVNAPLQDRQAEAILATILEEAPKVLADPKDYDARANLLWCTSSALNGMIVCGVPDDWTTHMMGHEITALFDLDHALTLTLMLPAVLKQQRRNKEEKILQYGQRIFGITDSDKDTAIDKTIEATENFFKSLGLKTRLSECGLKLEDVMPIADKFAKRGSRLGERGAVGYDEMVEIFKLAL